MICKLLRKIAAWADKQEELRRAERLEELYRRKEAIMGQTTKRKVD